MPKKNEMLVLIACDDKGARDQTAGLISEALTLARREGVGPINKVTNVVVEHCGARAGSMLAIMEEFQPGFIARVRRIVEPPMTASASFEEVLPDILAKKEVQESMKAIAQDKHRLEVARYIVGSERTDPIKIEELKHVLNPDISMKGKPADVQAVVEMALYGQMPDRSTNAQLTYKDGEPCKTIGTF